MKFGKVLESWLGQNQLHPQPALQYRQLKKMLKKMLEQPDNVRATGSPASASCDEQSEEPCNTSNGNIGLNLVQQQQQQQLQQQQLFISCLYNNLEHLNDFFIDQEEEAIMRLQTLRDSLTIVPVPHAARVEQASLTQHDLDAAKGSPSAHHAVDGGSSYVVSVQAKEALVQLHGDLVQVLHWALLNNAAVLKILKKHDKLTGQHLRGTLHTWLSQQPMSSLEVVQQLVREVEQLVGSSTTTSPPHQHRHPSTPSTDVATSSMPRTPQHASSEETTPAAAEGATHPSAQAGPSQLSEGGGGRAQRGPAAAAQQQLPATAVAAGSAMLQLTRAALEVWQRMGSGASTPSTVMPFPAPHLPPGSTLLPQPPLQQQQQLRRSESPVKQTSSPRTTLQRVLDVQPGSMIAQPTVGQKRRAEDDA